MAPRRARTPASRSSATRADDRLLGSSGVSDCPRTWHALRFPSKPHGGTSRPAKASRSRSSSASAIEYACTARPRPSRTARRGGCSTRSSSTPRGTPGARMSADARSAGAKNDASVGSRRGRGLAGRTDMSQLRARTATNWSVSGTTKTRNETARCDTRLARSPSGRRPARAVQGRKIGAVLG